MTVAAAKKDWIQMVLHCSPLVEQCCKAAASTNRESCKTTPDYCASILLEPTGSCAKLMDNSLRPQTLVARRSPRIGVKAKGKIVFMDPAEIIALEADGNCVSLCHTSGLYVIREPISSVAGKLDPFGFVRIHRCVLVNIAYIEELRRCLTGGYVLRVSNGKEYTITRTYKDNLRFLAESWLGTEI
jgi:DNA-binding LytR/AlgR family response regulator